VSEEIIATILTATSELWGNCRERAKKEIEFFKLYDRTSVDQPVD